MPTFFQKVVLGFRGWSRRRDEERSRRNQEFLARSTAWDPAAARASAEASPRAAAVHGVDLDGLQVAWLDDSGAIAYFLDRTTGELAEARDDRTRQLLEASPQRYRRVPQRSAQTDAEDRAEFVETVEDAGARERLRAAVSSAAAFRKAIAADRKIERAWYNFKNERADRAIAGWLRSDL